MSKLKVAKAIRFTFKLIKCVGIAILGLGAASLLWLWAVNHFLSFGIVFGILLALVLLGAVISAAEWSNETIEEAAKEERRAQERNRVEKDRLENPDKYVPSFHDEYYDPTDPLGQYH